MRKTNTITKEIVELSVIKSAYNHFLASYEAQIEVENTTLIQRNRTIVSENLHKLYTELEEAKKAERQKEDEAAVQPTKSKLRMKFITYPTTELEDRAIMHFNSDRRYTITE